MKLKCRIINIDTSQERAVNEIEIRLRVIQNFDTLQSQLKMYKLLDKLRSSHPIEIDIGDFENDDMQITDALKDWLLPEEDEAWKYLEKETLMNKIEVGDIVDVYFDRSSAIFNAEIISTPVATGDCFRLKDSHGNLYNVQQYDYMIKHASVKEELKENF